MVCVIKGGFDVVGRLILGLVFFVLAIFEIRLTNKYKNQDILHVDGSVNSIRDAETINLELIFADLDTVENRISKVEKKAKATKDAELLAEFELLSLIKETS